MAGALHVFAPDLFPSTLQLLAAKIIG